MKEIKFVVYSLSLASNYSISELQREDFTDCYSAVISREIGIVLREIEMTQTNRSHEEYLSLFECSNLLIATQMKLIVYVGL